MTKLKKKKKYSWSENQMSPLISVGGKEKSIVHDYVLKKKLPMGSGNNLH